MRKRKAKYSKEEFEKALIGAKSQSDVIKNLGLAVNNGNYETVRYWSTYYKVDLPIYNQDEAIEKLSKINRFTDEEWFVKDSRRTGQASKKRLIAMGYEDKCVECGQGPEHNRKKLTLQLDHINGDKFDNRIENLRILCPNCHTQTETYANSDYAGKAKRYYCECGKEIFRTSKKCSDCNNKMIVETGSAIKFNWPDLEELLKLVKETNYWQASKKLGVSDNAIRKHLKRNNIDPKTLELIEDI